MSADAAPRGNRLFLKKSIEQIQHESDSHQLKRSLGPMNLLFLGVGCIIGAGIYVMTGNAAANFAGPAVLLSFVLAFFACVFAGLCYAELASTMPVAGSAYTYSYTALGEIFAWTMGWLLVLEYGVAASTVAAGWSANVVSLLHQFGMIIPVEWTTSFIQAVPTDSSIAFAPSGGANILGAAGILTVTLLLMLGVSESASVNNVIVLIKVGILLLFIAMGIAFINVANWTPFIPANEGGFKYGWPGILRASTVIFFAYVGFEAVSTAAAEARNPKKDIPFGILGSLLVCTLIYMAVAAVLTGVVPFRELGVPAPIALAVDKMGMGWFSLLIKVGTVAGLSSVMLILTYAQSRVFYAMARDGLLPRFFATLHSKFRTPWVGTLILGVVIAFAAAMLPIDILGDLVSLGTATAFCIVCVSVLWLRRARPDMDRPFKAPGGVLTPLLGIFFALAMIGPLLFDIYAKAMTGDMIPAILLTGYLILGAFIYIAYGYRNSRLGKGLGQIDDDGPGPGALGAQLHGIGDPKSPD
ncbi:MAG: amino acid permease [Caulobacter sp.]|nr:amino acid permease [Caulobacter sp.]